MSLDLDLPTMRAMASRVSDLVTAHLASLRDEPVQRSLSRGEADRLIGTPDAIAPEHGTDFDALLEFLTTRVFPYHAREPHPRFMGYIPGCPDFPGVLGDWLATGYNFFAGVWPVAAGPNELELVVLEWFRQWLGMPAGARGILTSGGSAATVTAIVAARHARLGPEAARLPRLTVYTSEQAHTATVRAAWIAGFSRVNVRALPTDGRLRLRMDALREAIAADRASGLEPAIVSASAGTTSTGAVDPLGDIADLCEREGLWMHVDAAYGGFAVLSARGRDALDGIGRAHSITLDPHKWLFVPFECGCLMARDPRALEEAFSVHPEFLTDVRAREEEVNFADSGEQLTRYSRALKVWLSVRYYGLARVRAAVERGIALGEYAERRIREHPLLEVLSPAQLAIVCFRLHPPGVDDPQRLDALNERVNARVNGSGEFLFSSTRLGGAFAMRVCLSGFRTTEADVDALLQAIVEAARD